MVERYTFGPWLDLKIVTNMARPKRRTVKRQKIESLVREWARLDKLVTSSHESAPYFKMQRAKVAAQILKFRK